MVLSRKLVLKHQIPTILWITSAAAPENPVWSIETAVNPAEAMARLRTSSFDLVVLEPVIAGTSADELLEALTRESSCPPVLVHDTDAAVSDVVRYMRLGAHDVAGMPNELFAMIDAALELRRGQRAAMN